MGSASAYPTKREKPQVQDCGEAPQAARGARALPKEKGVKFPGQRLS
jgi:hypothetical protein